MHLLGLTQKFLRILNFMKINSAAVIGTGFIGTVHVESIRRTGVEVKGVLSGSAESTKRGAENLSVKTQYQSVAEIAADKDVTVVHVTSPNALHHPQVKYQEHADIGHFEVIDPTSAIWFELFQSI